jgi:hypothetical protein
MSHEMGLQLELFAAVADVASERVKGNSSLENVQTSAGLEVDDRWGRYEGFESLLVMLPVSLGRC